MIGIKRLKISANKRFIVHEDGSPFFWLGDTAWELFHKLNQEEASLYLETRAKQGYNVIQAVALAELDGLDSPNAYGRKPLVKNNEGQYDPTMPDLQFFSGSHNYWEHADYIIQKAASLGLYIALLPTWGDKFNILWGKGPVVFNKENAGIYGRWIAERYRDYPNIIWVMGGDRPLQTSFHFDVVNQMATAIKKVVGDKHLMTFHPRGDSSSSECVHDEPWLDFNMIQSGHMALYAPNYDKVKADYDRLPVKPVIDAEPRYEDHPVNFNSQNGYFDAFDTRNAAYWAVFAGAFGHTYGHHSIWSMCTEPTDYFFMKWTDALHQPGAEQMQYLRKLVESRPMLERVPDQSLIETQLNGANHMQATRGSDYAFIYSPNGLRFKVKMGIIAGETLMAQWMNPRNGEFIFISGIRNEGVAEFVPPTSGKGNDWVLVLDKER